MTAKSVFLALLVCLLFLAHQDFWFWRTAEPLLFGFLPVGLAYHAFYTLAVSALMLLLCRWAWPAHLDRDPGQDQDGDRR